MLESWHENCKLIWKLQTHMKIANSYENCKRSHRNYTTKCENCKLIWKLQTDMKIANWYENCKAILTFWCIVHTWTFAIFIWDMAEMKTCSGTDRMFRFDCGVDDKNTTKQSLAKPSMIQILITIPMLTHSDSYFKKWFLCPLTPNLLTWRNLEGYPAQPGLTRSSLCNSVCLWVRAKRGIWSKRVFMRTNGNFSFSVRWRNTTIIH